MSARYQPTAPPLLRLHPRTALLIQIGRRNWRGFCMLAAATAAVSACYLTLLRSQTYTAGVSLAVQQAAAGGGALAALTGNVGSDHYSGIARSHLIAAQVAQEIGLQRFYRLRSPERAVLMLQAGLVVDERPGDGLLFMTVSLPGPARLSPGQAPRRAAVRKLAAAAADAYAAKLQAYVENSDSDRDAVLLRQADDEIARSRAAFDQAAGRLQQLSGRLPAGELPEAPANTPPGPYRAGLVAGLTQALQAVQVEIRSDKASSAAHGALLKQQITHLTSLPTEDPLLAARRQDVAQAVAALNQLRISLGPDHPRVRAAEMAVALARQRLQQQEGSLLDNLTSTQVADRVKLAGLIARRDALAAELKAARSASPAAQRAAFQFERLEDEMSIALAARKATEEEAARVRMSAVSARTRLSLVDAAEIPEGGSPGLVSSLALSLLLGLGAGAGWIALLLRAMLREDEAPLGITAAARVA